MPFVLCIGLPAVVLFLTDPMIRANDDPPGFARFNEAYAYVVWMSVAISGAGALAGAASGKGHGWLGSVAGMAGLATCASIAVFSGALRGDAIAMVWYYVAGWVVLAVGYAPVHWAVCDRTGPALDADPERKTLDSGAACERCGATLPPYRPTLCRSCGTLYSEFSPPPSVAQMPATDGPPAARTS